MYIFRYEYYTFCLKLKENESGLCPSINQSEFELSTGHIGRVITKVQIWDWSNMMIKESYLYWSLIAWLWPLSIRIAFDLLLEKEAIELKIKIKFEGGPINDIGH